MAARQNNSYFLPANGIARQVITADVCRYLGNDALVKPGNDDQVGATSTSLFDSVATDIALGPTRIFDYGLPCSNDGELPVIVPGSEIPPPGLQK